MKDRIIVLLLLAVLVGGYFLFLEYEKHFSGIWPAVSPPPEDIADLLEVSFPLDVAEGFEISILADDLAGARDLTFDNYGNLWVSQTSEGKITRIDMLNGAEVGRAVLYDNLNKPHGLAFDTQEGNILYFAVEEGVYKVNTLIEEEPVLLVELPTGGRHYTRSLGFGPDDRLYVSIGSSCDTCVETDERRASIWSMEKDGSDFKLFADGLRNSVFFTWSYVDGRMWATEMGRDFLGDDLPPDELNVIEEGKFYGWPYCYGQNVFDSSFDNTEKAILICQEATPAEVDLSPAHVAPLGLVFIPEEGWPEDYWYDLIVAYHGSWNRTEPSGYKLMRIKLDEFGNYEGEEDFVSGWLTDEGALGRPVDVLAFPGGIMYVSDDKAGVIYRVNVAF